MNAADTVDIGSTAVVLLSGLFGMYVHWKVICARGRVKAQRKWFYQYLFTDNPNNGKLQLIMFASTMGGLYSLGTFDLVSYDYFVEALKEGALFKPTVSGIISAVGAGYLCDSAGSVSKKEGAYDYRQAD